MNPSSVFRYTIMVLSLLAVLFGILVMSGYLVPQNLHGQFGTIFGAVIVLYGVYRFVVAYFQRPK